MANEFLFSSPGRIVQNIPDFDERATWLDSNEQPIQDFEFGTINAAVSQIRKVYKLRNNLRHPLELQLNITSPTLYINVTLPRECHGQRNTIYREILGTEHSSRDDEELANGGREPVALEESGTSIEFRIPSRKTITVEFVLNMKDPMTSGPTEVEILLDEIFNTVERAYLPSGAFLWEKKKDLDVIGAW